ncbi:hypothetical protein [Yeosuana sp. AK3]
MLILSKLQNGIKKSVEVRSIGAIVLLVLNIVMLYAYKDKYKDLLAG